MSIPCEYSQREPGWNRSGHSPNACAIAWCPRQTPSTGMPARASAGIASTDTPASAGVHGPGERTMARGASVPAAVVSVFGTPALLVAVLTGAAILIGTARFKRWPIALVVVLGSGIG